MFKTKLFSLIFLFALFTISIEAKEPSTLINEIVNEASVILSSSDPVESKIIKLGKSIGFSSAELYQSEKIIAKASSSLKLIKLGEPKDFLIDNLAKDAKIIKA